MDSGHHSKCKKVLGTVSLAFFFDKKATGSSVWAQNTFCVGIKHVLCGHKTHSVWAQNTLCHIREEERPRVFENRMLRKIFGSKREETAGDSRKIRTH